MGAQVMPQNGERIRNLACIKLFAAETRSSSAKAICSLIVRTTRTHHDLDQDEVADSSVHGEEFRSRSAISNP